MCIVFLFVLAVRPYLCTSRTGTLYHSKAVAGNPCGGVSEPVANLCALWIMMDCYLWWSNLYSTRGCCCAIGMIYEHSVSAGREYPRCKQEHSTRRREYFYHAVALYHSSQKQTVDQVLNYQERVSAQTITGDHS